MKNLIFLITFSVSVNLNAQILSAEIEFPTGYNARSKKMSKAKSGEKTYCHDGMIYKYKGEYTVNDLLSVLHELEDFLANNDLDILRPNRSESTTFINSDMSLIYTSYIELMSGESVQSVWYLRDEDGQKYRAFLMLFKYSIEFSIDDREWITDVSINDL
ncbi:MAG: hypothetical protein ACI865_003351 [Flavobacteriaceae bacterium]|jgi:hypothetical protein